MPFNGTGTFVRVHNWVQDKDNNIPITASKVDAEDTGFATGLSTCITKDGQTVVTANIPLNSHKLTGLSVGNARTDSITLGQVQDNQFLDLGNTSGSADAYVASGSPTITAYVSTMEYIVKINATNLTTTPYLQLNAIASPASTAVIKKLSATKTEIAVEASDLLQNGLYKFKRNVSNDAWIVLNPEKPYVNLSNAAAATSSQKGLVYLGSLPTFSYNSGNVINTTTGTFSYSDGTGQTTIVGGTKTMSGWVAGSGNGSLDSGSVANNTWYYLYVIANISDPNSIVTDFLTSTNPTTPTLPTGYTKYKRLKGFFKTNGSASIISFYMTNNTWLNATTIAAEQTLVSMTSQVGSTGTVSAAFPAVANIAQVVLGMSTTATGYSSFTVWGNLQSTPTTGGTSGSALRASSIGTNNNFDTVGDGFIYSDNGILYFRNWESAGGIDSIVVNLLGVTDITQ